MSISLEIQGTIHAISKEQQVTDKFKKREFVLYVENEANPQYSDHIQLQVTQDKCAKLDEVDLGWEVKAYVNIRGREAARKDGSGIAYFTTLEAWKFDVVKSQPIESGLVKKEEMQAPPMPEDDADNLPF